MQKTLKKYWPVFVLPTLIAFAIAFILPFVIGLYLSFCDFTTIQMPHLQGLKIIKLHLQQVKISYIHLVLQHCLL